MKRRSRLEAVRATAIALPCLAAMALGGTGCSSPATGSATAGATSAQQGMGSLPPCSARWGSAGAAETTSGRAAGTSSARAAVPTTHLPAAGTTTAEDPGTTSGKEADATSGKETAADPTPETASGPECTDAQELDKYLLLKRLSLDLRNRLPSYEEYIALDDEDEVPDSLIDQWIASDEFRVSMRRFHESLLWPNPEGVAISDANTHLRAARVTTDNGQRLVIYTVPGTARRSVWRGSNVMCGAWLQEGYNADGSPVPMKTVYDGDDPSEVAYVQEGYVTVHPYWDPESTINVCAYDAQTATTGASADCSTREGVRDAKCGCGPDLQWCYAPEGDEAIWADMREQLGRSIDDVTAGGHPYTDLLTSQRVYMNGRLKFWKKHLAQMVSPNKTYNQQGIGDPALPDDPDWTDTRWTEETRTDVHAGVLTMPAYTLRFQTDRGRANRFRIAFTGQYFVPSSQPEDPDTADCTEGSSDLTQACTCRTCHQVLEPLAANFARVAEAGSTLISDLATYNAQCDPRTYEPGGVNYGRQGPPASCERFYAVDSDARNPGWLLAYQYAYVDDPLHDNEGLDDSLHRNIAENIEAGPAALGQTIIDSGELAGATVRNLFKYLMGREMILDPGEEDNELELLSELSAEFAADYSFPALVRRMVALPQYRRVR